MRQCGGHDQRADLHQRHPAEVLHRQTPRVPRHEGGGTDNTCPLTARHTSHVSIVSVSLARVGPGLNMLGQSPPDTLTL